MQLMLPPRSRIIRTYLPRWSARRSTPNNANSFSEHSIHHLPCLMIPGIEIGRLSEDTAAKHHTLGTHAPSSVSAQTTRGRVNNSRFTPSNFGILSKVDGGGTRQHAHWLASRPSEAKVYAHSRQFASI